MVNFHVITPEQYKESHSNFKIFYAFHPTPFGKCLIGIRDTDQAVLHLSFADATEAGTLDKLKKQWPFSELLEDSENVTEKITESIFTNDNASAMDSINVLLKGTEFQTKVWQSIMTIPRGTSTTYEKVAHMINNPKAIRAVGNAIAKNQIAVLIPCHRVTGKMSNKYAWGVERKQNILTYESKC